MGFEDMPKPDAKQEAIMQLEAKAEDKFRSMDMDMLKKIAEGSETEDEWLDNAPTVTEGLDESKIRQIAGETYEIRKEKEKGESN
jgi:hypothetical protein